MKRIIAHLRENWIKYGFETLVITGGILLAFGLNNWNDRRKERILEKEYLTQLVDELSSNHEVLISEQKDHMKTYLSCQNVVHALQKDLAYTDSLKSDFNNMMSPFMFNYNSSTYENLKSSGFNIITDSELRQQIQNVYVELEKLKEAMDLLTQEYLLTLNVQQQLHLDVTQGSQPRDYESLKANFVFINAVYDMGWGHRFSSKLSKASAAFVEESLIAVKAEITRLEGQ